ncbi:hypothetical protein [Streptomyces hoynatensis]|uniref:Uncharacterized protein n=1 Tax=Streptomyces hoynatensis TaxID=1141874 RepID=A0A3A9Z7B8_9ACTN|nr:hypothetical protein [Streptomyces hoynatensis]RKN43147.1 hypothetical protein D7294_11720 [Streptomyces hoynatensis]
MRVWVGFVMTVAAVALALLLAPLASAASPATAGAAAGEAEADEADEGGQGGAGRADGREGGAPAGAGSGRGRTGEAGRRPDPAAPGTPAPAGREHRVLDRHVLRWSPRPAVPGPVGDLDAWPPEPERFAAGGGGEVLPVLPLGAGLTCLGLGLGALGLRLRQS